LKEGVLDPAHAQQLIERILIAYGDDSVGELEGANVSFEDISNLATKVIQDRRIGGSPIEQSSRYVVYNQKDERGRWRYLRPREIMESAHAEAYERGMDRIFEIYDSLVEPLTRFYEGKKILEEAQYDVLGSGEKQKFAELTEEKDQKAFKRTYTFDLKTKTCDTIRCLLPCSTLTNVGMFGNGRYYQELLSHLYTQDLAEMHDIAKKGHEALNQIVAPFVKRARRNDWLAQRRDKLRRLAREFFNEEVEPCKTISVHLQNPQNPENPQHHQDPLFVETLTQALYPYTELSLETLTKRVTELSEADQTRILEASSGDRKHRRCRPDRALEAGYPLTFDLVCDFGSYRDLQRHRMLTQQRQLITPNLGFSTPPDLVEAGVLSLLEEAQEICEDLYSKIRKDCGAPAAQYVVLFGYKVRWTMGMNLRAAEHMIELRTTPQGHPNYRKVCQLMAKAILDRHPWAREILKFTDFESYEWARADSEARQRVKEKAWDEQQQEKTALEVSDET